MGAEGVGLRSGFSQSWHKREPVALAIREYSELRQLQAEGIGGRICPEALAAVVGLDEEAEEASPGLDRRLLSAAQEQADPRPLLALRCRVSHPLEAWLRGTHARFREAYGLDLRAMASYGLDDDGRQTIQRPAGDRVPLVYAELASLPKGLISPFSADVIRSYDPSKCGLPHWARLKIQAHNGLKGYFREHGLLLISDWALLRHSSGTRVREACARFLQSDAALEVALDLHRRFGPAYDAAMATYKQRTGKASGWQPELAFLRDLAPDRDPFSTKELLLGISKAIRTLQSGQWLRAGQAAEDAPELVDPSSLPGGAVEAVPGEEMRALIEAALQRAMDQHLPVVLSAGRDQALLRCLWAGWAEGLTNRPLADRCGTSPGTVSKKLRPTEHANTIATAAAVELKRHPAFASCGRSVEAAERLVAALRNHLLEPEREGEVAPLRRWIQQALSQP